MTGQLLTRARASPAPRPWPLELDVELAPSLAPVSRALTSALAASLAGVQWIGGVTVEPHCAGHFVLVRLSVDALDVSDAVEQACALVHTCAVDAGLGHVVLVAARCAQQPG